MTQSRRPNAQEFQLRPPVGQPPGQLAGFELKPPGAAPLAQRSGHAGLWLLAGGLLLLLLGVVFWLPETAPSDKQAPPPSSMPESTQMPTPAGAETPERAAEAASTSALSGAAERAAAEAALKDYLLLRARLESERAEVWGQADWRAALDAAERADQLYAQRRFTAAQAQYRQAAEAIEVLQRQKPARFKAFLAQALAATKQSDWAQAAERLSLALAIDPDNAQALALLARLEQRPQLLRLMEQGARHEANADARAALQSYRQARRLDADYAPARQAIERLAGKLQARVFPAILQTAFQALQAGELTAAEQALARAAKLKPEDPALIDAKIRLAAAKREAQRASLQRQVEEKIQAEDWRGALERYGELLRLEPGSLKIEQDQKHATARVYLHQQLDRLLAAPERLYAEQPRRNAERLLASVADGLQDEPLLRRKIIQLEQQVDAAKTPQLVSLRSDGQTQVTIYHVGRLGRFQSQEIRLLPGVYTVLGERDGYRDVREQILVKPGETTAPVLVQCRELI